MQTIIQKLSFYNEIELVHIFISDFHAFEKKLFCNQELVTKKYKLFVCWITIVEQFLTKRNIKNLLLTCYREIKKNRKTNCYCCMHRYAFLVKYNLISYKMWNIVKEDSLNRLFIKLTFEFNHCKLSVKQVHCVIKLQLNIICTSFKAF